MYVVTPHIIASPLKRGGWSGLQAELNVDRARLWLRNHGRDDRCISDHGREARYPFLDEAVVASLRAMPLCDITDLSYPRGVGEKLILRRVAAALGLRSCVTLAKRAIQFGTRIAKQSSVACFGSNKQATGTAAFVQGRNAKSKGIH